MHDVVDVWLSIARSFACANKAIGVGERIANGFAGKDPAALGSSDALLENSIRLFTHLLRVRRRCRAFVNRYRCVPSRRAWFRHRDRRAGVRRRVRRCARRRRRRRRTPPPRTRRISDQSKLPQSGKSESRKRVCAKMMVCVFCELVGTRFARQQCGLQQNDRSSTHASIYQYFLFFVFFFLHLHL